MAWSLFSQSQVSPLSWADAVLKAGGWPQTTANRQSLVAWALAEGGGGTYNPLNTTQAAPGAGSLPGNSAGVKDYTSWGEGVSATVQTLRNGDYPEILADLRGGHGIGGNASGNLSTWSGRGYSALAGTWTRAAGFLGGKSAPLPAGTITTTAASGGGGGSSGISAIIGGMIKGLFPGTSWGTAIGAGSAAPSALGDIGTGITGVATGIGTIAAAVDWFFVPSHIIRIFAGVGGGIFLVGGTWTLTHVGGDVTGTGIGVPRAASLPVGMLMVGVGGVGLFTAFHNLPPSVTDFPSYLGYLNQALHGQGQVELTSAPSGQQPLWAQLGQGS